jgi:hypothetical protein
MLRLCGNCGQEAARSSITFDSKGNVVRERCPHCDPAYFAEPFRNPSDNKIYSGPEAMPRMYKLGADGVLYAKDELLADTAALWDGGPSERARRHKEATRRTDPMTPEEIEQARKWGEQVLAPALRNGGMAAATAVLNHSE